MLMPGRLRTLADVHQQVRHDMYQHKALRTWLRDEEAMVVDQTWTRRVIDPPSVLLSALWTGRVPPRGVNGLHRDRVSGLVLTMP
jgi:hypothetical protein